MGMEYNVIACPFHPTMLSRSNILSDFQKITQSCLFLSFFMQNPQFASYTGYVVTFF